ncbi:hypothetical protein MMC07_006561 [Pseudocyphellaria aurata]|nr:hypothetical protein [Pseudocyphellaria aurata]
MQALGPSRCSSHLAVPATAATVQQISLLQRLNAPQAQPLAGAVSQPVLPAQQSQKQQRELTMCASGALVLPDSLTDALTQASESTVLALQGIGGRYLVITWPVTADAFCFHNQVTVLQVEVLIPEFWDPAAGAVFSEELAERTDGAQIAAHHCSRSPQCGTHRGMCMQLYPDSGVASMLQHQWQDAPFRIASLGDRNPVKDEDEIVILAAPDPQGELIELTNCRC